MWERGLRHKVVINFIVYVVAIICILPLVMVVVYSLTNPMEGGVSFLQYARVLLQTPDFFQGFWNSCLYTGVILAFNIPLSLLAAYGFSYFRWKGRKALFWLYIVLMLLPFQATIVAQYITLRFLHMLMHPLAVILPNIFGTFGTILVSQNMLGNSQETLEAGRIDGCSEWRLFIRIVLPALRSVITALMVLTFINSWSMVEQPLVFLEDILTMPLSVTLQTNARFRPIAFACGVLFSVLPILLYQYSYEDLVLGIRLSGPVKRNEENEAYREPKSNKQKVFKAILVFFLLMSTFTLLTQKVEHLMTPGVMTVKADSAEIKEDPYDQKSESLGFYQKVVPCECLHYEGADCVIYVLAEEKSARKRIEVIRVAVRVEAQNTESAAVTGGFSGEDLIVQYTNRPLREGMFVRVLEDGGHEEP